MAPRSFKKNGPICYRCGGMKHRRTPEGIRICPRFGVMPSGKRLNAAGHHISDEEWLRIEQRWADLRAEMEQRAHVRQQIPSPWTCDIPRPGWQERLRRHYHEVRRWMGRQLDVLPPEWRPDFLHTREI